MKVEPKHKMTVEALYATELMTAWTGQPFVDWS